MAQRADAQEAIRSFRQQYDRAAETVREREQCRNHEFRQVEKVCDAIAVLEDMFVCEPEKGGKRMKRTLALVCLIAVFMITGCGSDPKSTENQPAVGGGTGGGGVSEPTEPPASGGDTGDGNNSGDGNGNTGGGTGGGDNNDNPVDTGNTGGGADNPVPISYSDFWDVDNPPANIFPTPATESRSRRESHSVHGIIPRGRLQG